MKNSRSNAKRRLADRLSAYREGTEEAAKWLERNLERLTELLKNVSLRDFIFEPIKDVFSHEGDDDATAIRQTITLVAVANAVMAGLPGKMGVGVAVSMALEGWMAYVIARRVGLNLDGVSAIWKYFGLIAAISGVILYGFRHALGAAFSLFSVIPGLNPMILAELAVTNLVGVLFWVGFEEAKSKGSFAVPLRAVGRIASETKGLAAFQWRVIRDNLNPTALRLMASRLKAWLTGEIPLSSAVLRGDVASAVFMAQVLADDRGQLDGPIGREFVGAIRDRYPDLQEATFEEIADHMRSSDPDQLPGVMSMVKGKLFERLVAYHENQDQDEWRAVLHEDESYPGSDIILTSDDTGETIEISLKATDSVSYVEEALLKYPDIPVLTTEEVSQFFADDPSVSGAALSNEDLNRVTEENFDRMLTELTPFDVAGGAASGVAAGTAIGLWPFVVAFLRKRITQDQLEQACVRALGESGVALASRVSYAVVLGPIFAWYMLARGVMGLTRAANAQHARVRRLQWEARTRLN